LTGTQTQQLDETAVLAWRLVAAYRTTGLLVATAESCTGGLVAGAITDVAGASAVFDRGFVTYSNEAKMEMLGVQSQTLRDFGAVSGETAVEMALGALARSRADIAIAITGIAGPDGGTAQKPVGLVHFACARRGAGVRHVERWFGPRSRGEIRAVSVGQALELLLEASAI
jgi:nicotinamide-nucleotide amidase